MKRPHHATDDCDPQATRGDGVPVAEFLDRIATEMAACEALGDPELARHAGRMLLSVVACAADALLLKTH
jgi:hypothetical protein